jgi:asparagine synthase (glutamine-hydrolysing)
LDQHTFHSMRDSLAHRGPDDAGSWFSRDEGVMLGSRRLAILDLSPRGHQPMQDLSRKLTIVFNGEIYNFLELRAKLSSSYAFRTSSDTEVLLAAYAVWGIDCLKHLNGMFAFAIWDGKHQRLFAGRDRFGEKPFYYFRGQDFFLFASEIKALLGSRLIRPEPNLAAIYQFLAYRETDGDRETLLKDVFSLPAGHALVYSATERTLDIRQYWDLDPEREIRLSSDREYADRLLDLLKDSVKIRLRSDVAVGSSLSGGIDSSSIVGLMSGNLNGNGQATFSARFEDPAIDEGIHIRSVAERFPINAHSVFPNARCFVNEVEQFAWYQEHPFSNMSVYAQWCVMRLAKEQGVTVLLDGQGADENLGGYATFFGSYCKDLLNQKRWRAFLRAMCSQVRSAGLVRLGVVLAPLLSATSRQRLQQFREPLALTREFERESNSSPSRLTCRFRSALHNDLYQQLRSSMLPKLLRFADRNSMAFSREVRLPFLDHRVVEYLFAIPEEQKIRDATSKVVLRRAMQGIVPHQILERRDKKGFETPQSEWLAGPLRKWAEDILNSSEFHERGWIDSRRAKDIWKQFLARPSRHHNVICRWLSLEIWARTFLNESRILQRFASLDAESILNGPEVSVATRESIENDGFFARPNAI